MKVVHISTSDKGGAGIAASRLHLSLLENGIDSWFLTLYKFSDNIPNHIKFLPGDGAVFPFIKNGLQKIKRGLKHYHLYSSLSEKLAKEHLIGRPKGFEHFSFPFSHLHLENHPLLVDADVIHLHWVSDGFLDYKKLFTRTKKKIVWTLHDMNPFTGGCHHSDGCILFKDDCRPCFQLKGTSDENFAGKILEVKEDSLKNFQKDSMQIITPSKWLGDLSIVSKLFNCFSHKVIPNAFDQNLFRLIPRDEARKKLKINDSKKIIFVNSHHIDNHRKGLSFLIDALKLLPEEEYLLMAAGHTMRTEHFQNLLHLGYLNTEEQLSLAYSAADVFILPSLAENLPNTICESLLCGTPVVAFDTGGIKELVNEKNGQLVPLMNSQLLSQAIKTVTEKLWNREEIREAAISKVGKARVVNEHIQLYNSLTSAL